MMPGVGRLRAAAVGTNKNMEMLNIRRSERQLVNSDARILIDNQDSVAVVVTDISNHGLQLDALGRIPTQAVVQVEFPNGKRVSARTCWSDTFWTGVEFTAPLGDEELGSLGLPAHDPRVLVHLQAPLYDPVI